MARFIETYNLTAPPEYRLLDLVSEVGELAKDITETTGYGKSPEEMTVNRDEVGDLFFALLAFADAMNIVAEDAMSDALRKYEQRLDDRNRPASGN